MLDPANTGKGTVREKQVTLLCCSLSTECVNSITAIRVT